MSGPRHRRPVDGNDRSYRTTRSLLSSDLHAAHSHGIRVDLGGPTPGNSCRRLQWRSNDSVLQFLTWPHGPRLLQKTIASGRPSCVALDGTIPDVGGGLGRSAIGTVTAAGTAASVHRCTTCWDAFVFPMMSALQVRAEVVPEPSSRAMGLAGLGCFTGHLVWRRRTHA